MASVATITANTDVNALEAQADRFPSVVCFSVVATTTATDVDLPCGFMPQAVEVIADHASADSTAKWLSCMGAAEFATADAAGALTFGGAAGVVASTVGPGKGCILKAAMQEVGTNYVACYR